MMTFRVIRPNGSEWVEEASSVALNTPEQSVTNRQSVTVFLVNKETKAVDIYDGRVYVMNGNGKTIANFDLGAQPGK
jgi:hypothetical protein